MENPTNKSEATKVTQNPHKDEALALIQRLRDLEPMLSHRDFTEFEAQQAAHGLYRFMSGGLGVFADYLTRGDVLDYCNDDGLEPLTDEEIDWVLSDLDRSEYLSERKSELVREFIHDNLESRKHNKAE